MRTSSGRAERHTISCKPSSDCVGVVSWRGCLRDCKRLPSSESDTRRSLSASWRSNAGLLPRKHRRTDVYGSYKNLPPPNFRAWLSSCLGIRHTPAGGGSALVRRRIQTPSDAKVLSVVQPEEEVVLGASPPARRLPPKNRRASRGMMIFGGAVTGERSRSAPIGERLRPTRAKPASATKNRAKRAAPPRCLLLDARCRGWLCQPRPEPLFGRTSRSRSSCRAERCGS